MACALATAYVSSAIASAAISGLPELVERLVPRTGRFSLQPLHPASRLVRFTRGLPGLRRG
jgi:hypothetical protein